MYLDHKNFSYRYRSNSGSLGMLAAIRRARAAGEELSRRASSLLLLEIDLGQRLAVVVADDEPGFRLPRRTRRRDAALWPVLGWIQVRLPKGAIVWKYLPKPPDPDAVGGLDPA